MKIKNSSFVAVSAIVASFILSACVGSLNEIESLRVTPDSVVLEIGFTRTLTAIAEYSDGTEEDYSEMIEWSIADESIATVDELGVVVGVSPGTVEIQALDPVSELTAVATVTVTEASLEDVEMETEPSPTVAAGLNLNFRLYAVYSDGSRTDVTLDAEWSSSADATASVSNVSISKGTITALTEGEALITATFQGKSANVNVTVTAAVMVEVHVSGTAQVLAPGQTATLTATGVFSDGTEADVTASLTWYTSNYLVATVSGGEVLGVGPGEASIEGFDPVTGLSCTYQLTVHN